MKSRRIRRRLQTLVYQTLGYATNICHLPTELVVCIFKYLSKAELSNISMVSKYFHEIAFDQSLWQTYQLNNRKKSYRIMEYLPKMFNKISSLRVLKFWFCSSVDEKVAKILASHIDNGVLKELYLDGWEKINDNALSILIGRDPNFLQVEPKYKNGFIEPDRMPSSIKISKGLELLSLNECRNIHCSGIMKLEKMKSLKTLNLVGCVSIKDEGVIYLIKHSESLENINLSGTWITSDCIYQIVNESNLTLRNINIVGCKKLKSTDHNLLKINGFNVNSGEDVFRFNLLPEPFSGFRKITQSVLKTRSTLSIYRVYKYLARRMISDMNIFPPDYPETSIDHDEFMNLLNIEIVCGGVALPHHMQLKTVYDKYWDGEDLLTLYYRSKEEPIDTKFTQYKSECIPERPPIWIPDYISFSWNAWESDFTMFKRVHHCRSCGCAFCDSCSQFRTELAQFGYNQPVRVCAVWYKDNNPEFNYRKYTETLQFRRPTVEMLEAQLQNDLPQIIVLPTSRRNTNHIDFLTTG